MPRRSTLRTTPALVLGLALAALAAPADAQVASLAKGILTIEVGQGSAPVGGIAAQVAGSGATAPHNTQHGTALRFLAGYHFAEHVSVEVGVGHLGNFHSSAAYGGTDVLRAEESLLVIEGDLVGNIPLTANTRIDLTLGIAESALKTTLTTQFGSALATGQSSTDNVRRFGATAGVDLEWRLGDVSSVIVGYHLYPRVGSPALRDSASGTAKVILAGLKFEF